MAGEAEGTVRLDARACDAHELFAWGALSPLEGYLSRRDHDAVLAGGRLADGTRWRWPWTLRTDERVAGQAEVRLVEPEGKRLGRVKVLESWRDGDSLMLSGPVTLDRPPATGAFRELLRAPVTGAPERVGLLVDGALRPEDLLGALDTAQSRGVQLLLMPVVGSSDMPDDPACIAAVRSCNVAVGRWGSWIGMTALPLPSTWWRSPAEAWLAAKVARRFGVSTLLVPEHAQGVPTDDGTTEVLSCPTARTTDAALRRSLEAVRAATYPHPDRAGLVVLFTGLPSAGKTTLAHRLRDLLLGLTERTVTLWDGDIIRNTFSRDLSFSRADRLLNLSRLATVSTECARHGGVAICASIAPHEEGREAFRRGVSQVANMLLVHVATPIGECVRRDPKGLYAAAAAGQVTGLTGVDDPYEVPPDPDVVVGQQGEAAEDAARTVFAELVRRGWVNPASWADNR